LALFVLIAGAVNITKAVHIDDTAYLEMARAILRHPLHPLSQEINWGNSVEPIYNINQPPFIPYIYAFLIWVFGESELVLHLFIGLCSALAIFLFYLLANHFEIRHPLFLTGLFALGPSFLPGQNLMVDIPLMVFWLIFFWTILSAKKEDHKKYLVVGIAVAIACLTKYTSLVLFPIFVFAILYRGHWRSIWSLGIPVIVLALWSWFNYLDYGAIHILGRTTPVITLQVISFRAISWIAGMGSVSPFALSFISLKRNDPVDRNILLAALLSGAAIGIFMILTDQTRFAVYWVAFFIAGIFLTGHILLIVYQNAVTALKTGDKTAIEQEVVLGSWIAGTFAFIILFSPFIAIRHIFLVMPAILLILGRHLSKHEMIISRDIISFALTALLGVSLAVSDYYYSDMYRDYAYKIRQSLPQTAQVYQTGHWGWQWYSIDAGMIQYDKRKSHLRNGDYLVVPSHIYNQIISPNLLPQLVEVRRLLIPAPVPTWIRTMNTDFDAGGYYDFQFPESPPWRFSRAPFEFVIYQMIK
jgi:4-amino-4-deoxy-L-arabinose transferase-like glycosyltransferase